MSPQVEGIAQGEVGGVRVEGSAESTLQRYLHVRVFNCSQSHENASLNFSTVLSRCDQRKGPGACYGGGPGHRSHTKGQRYRSLCRAGICIDIIIIPPVTDINLINRQYGSVSKNSCCALKVWLNPQKILKRPNLILDKILMV